MTRNIKFYSVSLLLTIVLGGLLVLEMVWLVPMGLAGVAVFAVLEYSKIWVLRTGVANLLHQHPPMGGIFTGMIAGLLTMLWLASGLWMEGVLTEHLVLSIVMLLLVELACLAVPGKAQKSQQVPFQILYASVGKQI